MKKVLLGMVAILLLLTACGGSPKGVIGKMVTKLGVVAHDCPVDAEVELATSGLDGMECGSYSGDVPSFKAAIDAMLVGDRPTPWRAHGLYIERAFSDPSTPGYAYAISLHMDGTVKFFWESH